MPNIRVKQGLHAKKIEQKPNLVQIVENQIKFYIFFKKEDTGIMEYELVQLLEHSIYRRDCTCEYWTINPENASYRSAFLNGLDI